MNATFVNKIVEFDKYCKTCIHSNLIQNDNGDMPEPCNSCLNEPTNVNSKKPIHYEADEKLIKIENKKLEDLNKINNPISE